MKYDPNNELTEAQLKELSEDDFFAYLDAKSSFLKRNVKPLDTYHLKRFASITAANNGESLSDEEYKKLNKLGRINEMEGFDKEKHDEWIEKGHDVLKSVGVKNVKTHRSQWFD